MVTTEDFFSFMRPRGSGVGAVVVISKTDYRLVKSLVKQTVDL